MDQNILILFLQVTCWLQQICSHGPVTQTRQHSEWTTQKLQTNSPESKMPLPKCQLKCHLDSSCAFNHLEPQKDQVCVAALTLMQLCCLLPGSACLTPLKKGMRSVGAPGWKNSWFTSYHQTWMILSIIRTFPALSLNYLEKENSPSGSPWNK